MSDNMNLSETRLSTKYPALTRIRAREGPPPISVTITKNHYPDFKILYPEEEAGLWVESKGHIQDRSYFLMLENFPENLKKYYRVIITHKNKKEMEKMGKRLDKIGIIWCSSPLGSKAIPKQWFQDAVNLWEEKQCRTKTSDDLKTTHQS